MIALCALAASLIAAPEEAKLHVRAPDEIEFTATVHAGRFQGWIMPGYHAIVWRGGSAAPFALLVADPTDVEVLDAIQKLGARPGPTIPIDAWRKRKDAESSAPDAVARGPRIEILLRLPDRKELVPLSSVLEDSEGRGLEMRLAGNRANVSEWESGCVACLYSCPGGKVDNARYTVREYAKDAKRFRVREGALPKDGTRIGVVLRVESPGP